jgi:hypothetical protein
MTKKTESSAAVRPAKLARRWQNYLPLGLTLALPRLLRADSDVDYRNGFYIEDNHRMVIETHSVNFDLKLSDSVAVKGGFVYDGVSGATPVGTHLWSFTGGQWIRGAAKTIKIDSDERYAGNAVIDWKLGNNTLSPGFSVSTEHDYLSFSPSLSDAWEFNDKNTILQAGISHNFDSVRTVKGSWVEVFGLGHFRTTPDQWASKDSTEAMVGISQLLSPKTILTANVTYGYDTGFLSDPYRLAEYGPSFLPFTIGIKEVRPRVRSKEVFQTSLTQYFESVNGSLEGNFRVFHDSYDITSEDVGLTWHQWLGKHVIVEPFARFYYQSAASFYSPVFTDPVPTYHSSDYRLSEFCSTDFGLQVTGVINDHVHIVAGYHRYSMFGLDGKTTSDMYPKANVFTIGFNILW